MRQLRNPCASYRASLCLLACGELPSTEGAQVDSHLAACADCRKYYDEINSVAGPLAAWEPNFANVEPSPGAQTHWAENFAAAARPSRSAWMGVLHSVLDWCGDMVQPSRHIWAGLAAMWLVILITDFLQREPVETLAMKSSRPSPELVRAFLEQEGFLAQTTKPGQKRAESPKI